MQSFTMALRSIGANKMRSVLTMLGIIIGVMALVVLVSLVSGTTDSVTGAVSDLGTSLVTVTVSRGEQESQRLEAASRAVTLLKTTSAAISESKIAARLFFEKVIKSFIFTPP